MRPIDHTQRRLLVIDDSATILRLVEARLRGGGLVVSGEVEPLRGLERAADEIPGLILLDIDLPGANGFDICRRLKENAITRQIPVIFLSGNSDSESRVRGLDLGAVDFVPKPFDRFELQARVRAALRTRELLERLERESFLDGLTGL